MQGISEPSRVRKAATEYPARLLRLAQAPESLWVRGRLPRDGASRESCVAIVGSRAASESGRSIATALATGLGAAGHAIVSGGALGIDAAAHRGALQARAATFAILGCGVDVVYPDRHARLFDEIAGAGGLVSEYEPGTAPRKGNFPARNRIIVALSDAVIVVEARSRSGALVTARLARAQGVPLLAVPGSEGTDALIGSGSALAVQSAAHVEDALAGRLAPSPPEAKPGAPSAHHALLAALREKADTPGGLAARLRLPVGAVLAALAEAELDGQVHRAADTRYSVAFAG
jgi:DNA processing protein